MQTESIYDILVRPAPPDEPEHVSKATARMRPKQRFASLIGGTTMQEKEAIEEELEEQLEEVGGLTRDGISRQNLETTSVIKAINIDLRGRFTAGPFDALGLPARLIRPPNGDDGETLVNPGEQPSPKIQQRLMAKTHSETLATMPSDVLINQISAVQDTLSTDHPLLEEPSRREEEEVRRRSATPRSVRKTRNSMSSTSTNVDMPETENSSLPSGRERSTPHPTTGGRREEQDFPRRIAVPRAIRKARNSTPTTSSSVDLAETGSSVLPSTRGRSTPGSSTTATPLSFGGSTQPNKGMLPPAGKSSATDAVEESAEVQGPCTTCVAMGIRCNRQKPECHWCRHAGYECSFKIESHNPSTTVALEAPAEAQGPCTTCVAMGIRCNRQQPECHWCRHAGYECSFKTMASKPVTNLLDDSMTDFVRSLNLNTDTAHPDPGLDTRIPKDLQPKPTFGQERNVEKKGNRKRNAKQLRRTQLFDRDGNFVTPEQDRIAYTTPFTQEENYHNRPSIRISIPDHLKNLLVDDWENVTKSLLLVPLPSQAPANFILDEYFNEEKTNRRLGSVEADILEEFCSGLKTYFEKAIGKILLYRFERPQLNDVSPKHDQYRLQLLGSTLTMIQVRKLWESGKFKEWDGKGPGDCYGAEHLTRMIGMSPPSTHCVMASDNVQSTSPRSSPRPTWTRSQWPV